MTRRFVLYKRWKPRQGATSEAILQFVRDQTVPAYERLSPEVEIGLELLADGRAVLAIQRWSSRRAYEEATTGAEFDEWWRGYQPCLAEWDRLLQFEREWETIELVGPAALVELSEPADPADPPD